MKYKRTRTGITRQDLAQDRAFWRDLLARRTSLRGLPAHTAGGYRNPRFTIIRDAAWITLYRATLPFPQMGDSSAAPALPVRLSSRWLITPVQRLSRRSGQSSARTWRWNGAPPTWDDRYRSDPARPVALARQLGGTAYHVDASGRRRVVELFRVPGRRSGGEPRLPAKGRGMPLKRTGSASGAVEPRRGSRNAMLGLSYVSKIRRPPSSSMSLTPADFITSACILRPAWWMRLVISCVAFTTSGWSSWPG